MTNFKTPELRQYAKATKRIRRVAKAFINSNLVAREAVVLVQCAGGCGGLARVRADRVREGVIFVCNRRDTRDACLARIPRVVNGRHRKMHLSAAGYHTGLTWERAPWHHILFGRVLDALNRFSSKR